MKSVVNCINEASIGRISPNVCDYSASGRKVTCWLSNDKEFFNTVLPKLELDAFDTEFEEMDYMRITFDWDRNTVKIEFPDMWTADTVLLGLTFKSKVPFEKLKAEGKDLKESDLGVTAQWQGWKNILKSEGPRLDSNEPLKLSTRTVMDCQKIIAAYFNSMAEPLF